MIEIVKPIGVRTYGKIVIVEFNNSVETRFIPYTHGFGYQIEGLHSFEIRTQNGTLLFKYNARLYRCGPQPDEHKVTLQDEYWTQQKAAEYWELSKQYVTKLFAPNGICVKTEDKHWYHWRVLTEGGFDLERLKKGEVKILQ